MNVHTIEVSFRRAKQPKEYESSEPQIRLVASDDNGTPDYLPIAKQMMLSAQTVVYGALGMDVPPDIRGKLDGSGATATTTTAPAAGAETTKGKPGRPTKAEQEAKEKAAAAAAAAAAGGKPNISASPENRVDPGDIPGNDAPAATTTKPAADPGGIPGDEAPKAPAGTAAPGGADVSVDALQGYLTKNIAAKKMTAPEAKEMIKEAGGGAASRLADLSAEQRVVLFAKLKAKCEGTDTDIPAEGF